MSVLTTKILPENDFYIAYNVVGISLFDSLTVFLLLKLIFLHETWHLFENQNKFVKLLLPLCMRIIKLK